MYKYSSPELEVLALLREKSGLTQDVVAKFFGLKSRDAVSSWERGKNRPSYKSRERFIVYLLDKLRLSNRPEKLLDLWDTVMVKIWRWEPLSKEELKEYLGSNVNYILQDEASKKIEIIYYETKAPGTPSLAPSRPPYELVGRENIFADLQQCLMNRAISTLALYGLPGVGKTALAIALAHDLVTLDYFHDGVLWAGLQPDPDISSVLLRWAITLGIQEKLNKIPDSEVAEAIRAEIGLRRMLIIIDDVWETESASALKLGGPHCTHVITTRSPEVALKLAGNNVYFVQELTESDSLVLLKQLAPQVINNEEENYVQELIRVLGGLPLGLVLIGNYLRIQGHSKHPRRIRDALSKLRKVENRLHLMETQTDVPISLNSAISVSIDQLERKEREALMALSVFPPKPNSFSEVAALEISDSTTTILDRLTDVGLLETVSAGRYTLHQVLTDYARFTGMNDAVNRRMIHYFVNYVESNKKNYEALLIEFTNIRYALELSSELNAYSDLIRLSENIYKFLETRGLYELASSILSRVEEAARYSDDRLALSRCLMQLGRIAEKRGLYEKAKDYLITGLTYANELNDMEMIVQLHRNLGAIYIYLGEYTRAEASYVQGLELTQTLKDTELECDLLTNLGGLNVHKGNFDLADTLYQRALRLARQLDLKEKLGALLQNLGAIAERRGNLGKAETHFREGLALAQEVGDPERTCHLLANLGEILTRTDRFDEAEQLLEEGLRISEDFSLTEIRSYLLVNLGALASHQGNNKNAERRFSEGLSLARDLQYPWLISNILISRGDHFASCQRMGEAKAAFEEALQVAQEAKVQELINIAKQRIASV